MEWYWWVLIGVVFWVMAVLFILALAKAAAPSHPAEQAAEDEAQVKYIEEWFDQRGKTYVASLLKRHRKDK